MTCIGCSAPLPADGELALICHRNHLARFDEPVAYVFCVACYFVHCDAWREIDNEHEVYLQ